MLFMKIVAYSRLRDSRLSEIAEIAKARRRKQNGRKLGRGRAAAPFHFPAFALFFAIVFLILFHRIVIYPGELRY